MYRCLPCLLLLVMAFGAGPAAAQLSTAVAPARVEKLVNPGGRVSDVLTFINQGDFPVTVSLSLADFDVSATGEVVELPPGTQEHSVAPFFRISPLRMTVGPRERADFRFSVETPEDFEQLRAFVYFESEPEVEAGEGQQVLFATAMGIPFYVENRKAPRGQLTVHEAVVERAPDDASRLVLRLHVTNTGARNVRPRGFLTVRSADDSFLETFDVNTSAEVVLPGHERFLHFEFGPTPAVALEARLRLETSARTRHDATYQIPASEGGGMGQ